MQEIFMKIFLSIFFFLSSSSPKQLLAIGNNNTDYKSLIAFKNQFLKQGNGASPAIFMASWNDTNNICSWEGVTCGRKHSGRVAALDLNSCGLLGPLPPSIANLSFLIGIDLSNNSLYGEIPPNLARLPRLQHLNLSFNSFHGDIGALFMTNNSVLQAIDLGNNQLTGKIPPFINSVSFLNYLGLDNNHIIGSIPPSLDNLSFLESFYVLGNHLEGSIPPEIGGLCKLRELKLAENDLSGNLDTWLHKEYETSGDDVLSLEKRLNIAINVGDALEYLHHSCNPPIIHCDIKPSNILLDNNMIAHVGDFGLSKIFSEAINMPFQDYSDKSEIKRTIGYVAPEYGEGARPSISVDVYSFGIIVLEILTGRRPTDDIFKDNLNIHNHVKMAFPQRINSIIDLKMFTEEHKDADYSSYQHIDKCLLSLTEVGLSCSTSSSEERPCMRDVAKKLHTIKVSYLQYD